MFGFFESTINSVFTDAVMNMIRNKPIAPTIRNATIAHDDVTSQHDDGMSRHDGDGIPCDDGNAPSDNDKASSDSNVHNDEIQRNESDTIPDANMTVTNEATSRLHVVDGGRMMTGDPDGKVTNDESTCDADTDDATRTIFELFRTYKAVGITDMPYQQNNGHDGDGHGEAGRDADGDIADLSADDTSMTLSEGFGESMLKRYIAALETLGVRYDGVRDDLMALDVTRSWCCEGGLHAIATFGAVVNLPTLAEKIGDAYDAANASVFEHVIRPALRLDADRSSTAKAITEQSQYVTRMVRWQQVVDMTGIALVLVELSRRYHDVACGSMSFPTEYQESPQVISADDDWADSQVRNALIMAYSLREHGIANATDIMMKEVTNENGETLKTARTNAEMGLQWSAYVKDCDDVSEMLMLLKRSLTGESDLLRWIGKHGDSDELSEMVRMLGVAWVWAWRYVWYV